MITSQDVLFEYQLEPGIEPGRIERFAADISIALAALGLGTTPCLSRVEHGGMFEGKLYLTAHVHLLPNLILPIRRAYYQEGLNPDFIVREVKTVWPSRHSVAQEAECLRAAAEVWLERQQAALLDLRVADIRVETVEELTGERTYGFYLVMDVIGDDLRPFLRDVYLRDVGDVDRKLTTIIKEQRRRLKLRRHYTERGATGAMNRLTRAAIEKLTDPARALRELSRNQAIWPDEAIHIAWEDGRLVSWGKRYKGLTWSDCTLELAGVTLPETALEASVGKPITTLCSHPLLDETMTIVRAWNFDRLEELEPTLVVELADNDYLFSSARAWIDQRPLEWSA